MIKRFFFIIMGNYTLSTDVRETHKYPIEILKTEEFINEVRTVFINIGTLYLNNKTLYKKLVNNNLLYTYFPNEKHSDDYWNETTCLEISKIFSNVEDFFRCYPKAYETADYNKWILTYTWIIDREKHPNFYWTKERIIHLIESENILYKEQLFRCSGGAYKAAMKNKWLDEFFPENFKHLVWDENACYQLALECHTISEMEDKSPKAAKHARDNGWIEQYTWFSSYLDNLKDFRYCVYLYTDGIAAYIGLTRDYRLNKRHYEHDNKKYGQYDSVKTYFNNKNEKLPKPSILKENLTYTEAQYYEGYYINNYKENGYIILNKIKTGIGSSSLGGGYMKNTKEYCEEVARKYKTLKEFYKNEEPVYQAARRNNWLKDYTWLERREQEIVTYDEAYTEAKKYKYFGEFSKYAQRQYNAAYKKGWLKDYTWLEYENPKRTYKRKEPTRKECFDAAKLYSKVKQFCNHETTLYKISREKKWFDDYIWFQSVYRRWTHERCEEEARKYKTLKDFEDNCYGGYHVSVNEGWISEFDWLN